MNKIVAIYARLSPRPDGSYEGIDVQTKAGREYVAAHWSGTPVEVFADPGISAANGDHRPEFERFREWLAAGRIAHVWAVEQSRLERREVEWFRLAAELDAAGIAEVHTARDGIVRVRDEVSGIKAVLAAGEVRRIKARVNDRLAANAANGEAPPVTPYGYQRPKDGTKTLAVDEDQAANIRYAADRILAGWSLTAVAAELDGRGVRGRSGGRVNATSVRSWITSPSMAGLRVHRGRIVGNGNWQPILHPDVWRAVKARLATPRTVRNEDGATTAIRPGHLAHRTARRYWLTGGLAICGVCGARLTGAVTRLSPGAAARPYLKCKGGHLGIDMTAVENHVLDLLWAELDRPAFLDELGVDDAADRRAALDAALDAVERQREDLAGMWGRGDLGAAEWRAAREALDARENDLRAERADLPAPVVGVDIAEAREAWPDLTLGERRQLVRIFIERITVNRATKLGPAGFDPARVAVEWRRSS